MTESFELGLFFQPYQNIHVGKVPFLPLHSVNVAKEKSVDFSASKNTHETFYFLLKNVEFIKRSVEMFICSSNNLHTTRISSTKMLTNSSTSRLSGPLGKFSISRHLIIADSLVNSPNGTTFNRRKFYYLVLLLICGSRSGIKAEQSFRREAERP